MLPFFKNRSCAASLPSIVVEPPSARRGLSEILITRRIAQFVDVVCDTKPEGRRSGGGVDDTCSSLIVRCPRDDLTVEILAAYRIAEILARRSLEGGALYLEPLSDDEDRVWSREFGNLTFHALCLVQFAGLSILEMATAHRGVIGSERYSRLLKHWRMLSAEGIVSTADFVDSLTVVTVAHIAIRITCLIVKALLRDAEVVAAAAAVSEGASVQAWGLHQSFLHDAIAALPVDPRFQVLVSGTFRCNQRWRCPLHRSLDEVDGTKDPARPEAASVQHAMAELLVGRGSWTTLAWMLRDSVGAISGLEGDCAAEDLDGSALVVQLLVRHQMQELPANLRFLLSSPRQRKLIALSPETFLADELLCSPALSTGAVHDAQQWLARTIPGLCLSQEGESRFAHMAFRVACRQGCLALVECIAERYPDVVVQDVHACISDDTAACDSSAWWTWASLSSQQCSVKPRPTLTSAYSIRSARTRENRRQYQMAMILLLQSKAFAAAPEMSRERTAAAIFRLLTAPLAVLLGEEQFVACELFDALLAAHLVRMACDLLAAVALPRVHTFALCASVRRQSVPSSTMSRVLHAVLNSAQGTDLVLNPCILHGGRSAVAVAATAGNIAGLRHLAAALRGASAVVDPAAQTQLWLQRLVDQCFTHWEEEVEFPDTAAASVVNTVLDVLPQPLVVLPLLKLRVNAHRFVRRRNSFHAMVDSSPVIRAVMDAWDEIQTMSGFLVSDLAPYWKFLWNILTVDFSKTNNALEFASIVSQDVVRLISLPDAPFEWRTQYQMRVRESNLWGTPHSTDGRIFAICFRLRMASSPVAHLLKCNDRDDGTASDRGHSSDQRDWLLWQSISDDIIPDLARVTTCLKDASKIHIALLRRISRLDDSVRSMGSIVVALASHQLSDCLPVIRYLLFFALPDWATFLVLRMRNNLRATDSSTPSTPSDDNFSAEFLTVLLRATVLVVKDLTQRDQSKRTRPDSSNRDAADKTRMAILSQLIECHKEVMTNARAAGPGARLVKIGHGTVIQDLIAVLHGASSWLSSHHCVAMFCLMRDHAAWCFEQTDLENARQFLVAEANKDDRRRVESISIMKDMRTLMHHVYVRRRLGDSANAELARSASCWITSVLLQSWRDLLSRGIDDDDDSDGVVDALRLKKLVDAYLEKYLGNGYDPATISGHKVAVHVVQLAHTLNLAILTGSCDTEALVTAVEIVRIGTETAHNDGALYVEQLIRSMWLLMRPTSAFPDVPHTFVSDVLLQVSPPASTTVHLLELFVNVRRICTLRPTWITQSVRKSWYDALCGRLEKEISVDRGSHELEAISASTARVLLLKPHVLKRPLAGCSDSSRLAALVLRQRSCTQDVLQPLVAAVASSSSEVLDYFLRIASALHNTTANPLVHQLLFTQSLTALFDVFSAAHECSAALGNLVAAVLVFEREELYFMVHSWLEKSVQTLAIDTAVVESAYAAALTFLLDEESNRWAPKPSREASHVRPWHWWGGHWRNAPSFHRVSTWVDHDLPLLLWRCRVAAILRTTASRLFHDDPVKRLDRWLRALAAGQHVVESIRILEYVPYFQFLASGYGVTMLNSISRSTVALSAQVVERVAAPLLDWLMSRDPHRVAVLFPSEEGATLSRIPQWRVAEAILERLAAYSDADVHQATRQPSAESKLRELRELVAKQPRLVSESEPQQTLWDRRLSIAQERLLQSVWQSNPVPAASASNPRNECTETCEVDTSELQRLLEDQLFPTRSGRGQAGLRGECRLAVRSRTPVSLHDIAALALPPAVIFLLAFRVTVWGALGLPSAHTGLALLQDQWWIAAVDTVVKDWLTIVAPPGDGERQGSCALPLVVEIHDGEGNWSLCHHRSSEEDPHAAFVLTLFLRAPWESVAAVHDASLPDGLRRLLSSRTHEHPGKLAQPAALQPIFVPLAQREASVLEHAAASRRSPLTVRDIVAPANFRETRRPCIWDKVFGLTQPEEATKAVEVIKPRAVDAVLDQYADGGLPESTLTHFTDMLERFHRAARGELSPSPVGDSSLCGVCYVNSLHDDPVLLQCFHLLCQECTAKLRKHRVQKCPFCQAYTLVAPKVRITAPGAVVSAVEDIFPSLVAEVMTQISSAVFKFAKGVTGSVRRDDVRLHIRLVLPNRKWLALGKRIAAVASLPMPRWARLQIFYGAYEHSMLSPHIECNKSCRLIILVGPQGASVHLLSSAILARPWTMDRVVWITPSVPTVTPNNVMAEVAENMGHFNTETLEEYRRRNGLVHVESAEERQSYFHFGC